jgi:putative acetyltransferase
MERLFPPEDNHYLSLDALRGPDIRFFIAEGPEREEDDETESERERIVVGCGALAIRDGYGELKSMYITPGSRRRGVAQNILTRLEEEAKAEGLSLVRLETGNLLRDALSLYRKMGFVDREAFGDYTANETSVFMEKRLT